jgi:CPA1 family monovalent cation:H+ antiporter
VINNALVFLLLLVIVVALFGVLAERMKLPSPAIMLLVGAAMAFIPAVPQVHTSPDVVLLVFLPPLLYSAGVGMSWRGFRTYKRPILLLAIGAVAFTAAAVAAVAHYALDFDWSTGFVLGAIVSPPDAVLVVALLRSVQLPRRLVTILEGESLVNDATALVILAFALEAATTGSFSLEKALIEFVAIFVGEVAFGVALGWALLRVRHWAASPRAEVLLALASPFIAFWPAHAVGGSGVIACVASGLYISWNGRRFISPDTRLQGYFIWGLAVWTTESLIFLVGGLQARDMVEAFQRVGWHHALIAGALVMATIFVVRFIWVYPATYIPRLFPASWGLEVAPNWRHPFFVSYAGLRGVDSLAAALLVPLLLNGAPFPGRDVILFSTFFVIGTSLLVIGPTLSPVIRWIGLDVDGREEADSNRMDERQVRAQAIDAVLAFVRREEAPLGLTKKGVAHILERRRDDIVASGDADGTRDPVSDETELHLALIAVERGSVDHAYDENRLTDEARRRIERELDLQEAVLKNQRDNLRRDPGTER